MKGVVAAGHPLTAEAGAKALRAGGNAIDAACAAMLMSWVTESPLTGPGAGGFMLVHTAEGQDHLLDFFVAAPGRGLTSSKHAELMPVDIHFSEEVVQVFNVGPSSNGVPGTPLGVAEALERFGTLTLADLTAEPARAAREGVELNVGQGHLHRILHPIMGATAEGRAIYEPEGRPIVEGETIRQPELGDLLERLGNEGPAFIYEGETAARLSEWVLERGGLLTREDLASYEVIERLPARARYHGREILTNPPPASGGILIAYALDLLERLGDQGDRYMKAIVHAMDAANRARTPEFTEGLNQEGYMETFLAAESLQEKASEVSSRLGSTTHLSALDADGNCASVTCSNGSGSAVIVPGTGVHLNNMLGEEDLNPGGFHLHTAGKRVSSMMAPTVVLKDGQCEVALGSAGSNRIRSAVLQTALNVIDGELDAQPAVDRHRIHVEGGKIDAEPGTEDWLLDELEAEGWRVQRWRARDLYFGGVQAVARDGATGALTGGGDPRRGGASVCVD